MSYLIYSIIHIRRIYIWDETFSPYNKKNKLAMRQRTIFTQINFVTPTNLNEFLEIKQRVAVHFKQTNFTMAMRVN